MAKQLLPHVVAQGEHLEKLAFLHGFDAREVWKDPKNDAIRALRKDPLVLAPGDIVFIPAPEKTTLPVSMGTTNKYKAKVPVVEVHLVLHDEGGGPLADEPYLVEGLGGAAEAKERKTSEGGAVSFEAKVHLREVTLFFPRKHLRLAVRVGDLDPLEERSGLAGRLANRGFLALSGPPTDEQIKAALQAFQRSRKLSETGILDSDTRSALESAQP